MDIFRIKDRDKTLVQIDKEVTRRKIENFKNTVIDGTKMAVEWGTDHPVEAIGVLAMIGSAFYRGSRIITRNREIKHEQYIADCRFYDNRIGEYVFSRKKLSNEQKIRFNKLYQEGMTKREALTMMGLIKD